MVLIVPCDVILWHGAAAEGVEKVHAVDLLGLDFADAVGVVFGEAGDSIVGVWDGGGEGCGPGAGEEKAYDEVFGG